MSVDYSKPKLSLLSFFIFYIALLLFIFSLSFFSLSITIFDIYKFYSYSFICWGEYDAGNKNIRLERVGKEQWEYEWNGTCGMERVYPLLWGAEEDA